MSLRALHISYVGWRKLGFRSRLSVIQSADRRGLRWSCYRPIGWALTKGSYPSKRLFRRGERIQGGFQNGVTHPVVRIQRSSRDDLALPRAAQSLCGKGSEGSARFETPEAIGTRIINATVLFQVLCAFGGTFQRFMYSCRIWPSVAIIVYCIG